MKKLIGVIGVLIVLPCWFWLLYQVLQRVGATELMWFIYWAYVPANMFVAIGAKLTED